MTNIQLAERILRFYSKKRIELECSQKGEEFNEENFETSFQAMLASEDGQRIMSKIKSAEDASCS